MHGVKSGLRSSVAMRCLFACALATSLAGCSSEMSRFGGAMFDEQEPQYTGSITPTPAVPVQGGDGASTYGAPSQYGSYDSGQGQGQYGPYSVPGESPSYGNSGGVQSSPLDRPATGQPAYGNASQGASPYGGPARNDSSSDGSVVVLRQGETLDTISRRYSIPQQALMDVNGISDPNSVRPGQQLLVPVYSRSKGGWVAPQRPSGQAPVQQASAPAAPSQPGGTYASQQSAPAGNGLPRADRQSGSKHRVQPGETIYSIGRTYNVSPAAIIAANDLDQPNNVRIGTDLVIPGASGGQVASAQSAPQPSQSDLQPKSLDQQAAERQQQARQSQSAPQPQSRPQQQAQQAEPQQKNVQVAEAPSSGQTATDAGVTSTQALAGGNFRWPVRGRVISSFGDKGSAGKNDGINISVPEGTAVRAAEEGVVAYAGNELKGYGNLVLVRHKDDWVTAYAHNSDIMVERGDTVTRGQVIAKAGQSGSVNAPQVHFEVRRNSTPVDPLKYLAEE